MPNNLKEIILILFIMLFSTNVSIATTQQIPFEELKKFSQIYNILKNNYIEEKSGSELIDYAIKGMVNNLDPHSKYLQKKESDYLKESIEGAYAGIGIEIEKVESGLLIVTPFDNSPAKKADLRTNDIIVKVDDIYITTLKNIEDAVELLRGKEGTELKITIKREKEYLEKKLKREKIKLESITSKLIEDKYAYIRISSFQENTSKNLKREIVNINKKHIIEGYVLDLRNNPGGLLNSAIEIIDYFIDEKETAVSIKSRNEERFYYTEKGEITKGKPIIVIINEGSASASEIVAGALQDLNRGIIIGNKSFGKGSVQEIISFLDNTSIKYTSAIYHTPSGRSIQAEGITPDIIVNDSFIEVKKNNLIREKNLEGHIENKEDNKEEIYNYEDNYIKTAIDTLKIINHTIKK